MSKAPTIFQILSFASSFFFFSLSLTLFEFSYVMIVKYSEFEEYLPVGECNVYKNLRLF